MSNSLMKIDTPTKLIGIIAVVGEGTLVAVGYFDQSLIILVAISGVLVFVAAAFSIAIVSIRSIAVGKYEQQLFRPIEKHSPLYSEPIWSVIKDTSQCELLFEEDKFFDTKELSAYLYYFRIVYVICVYVTGGIKQKRVLEDKDYFLRKVYAFISEHKAHQLISDAHFSDLREGELQVIRLKKESPFEIVLTGLLAALVLAVIISGGTVDVKGVKFRLQPLGDGLKKLREALKQDDKP